MDLNGERKSGQRGADPQRSGATIIMGICSQEDMHTRVIIDISRRDLKGERCGDRMRIK